MTVTNKLILLSLVSLLVVGFPSKFDTQQISGSTKAAVTLEKVPSKASGISWVHQIQKSAQPSHDFRVANI